MAELEFYSTLTRKKEVFKPLHADYVRMYDCGPTVYMYAHIGNMWRNIMSDLIRRVLEYNGYEVKQVMNITDVGHLTGDDLLAADTGEDKIEKAARKEKKTPQEIAEFYTQAFLKDLDRINIQRPHVLPKASEHIEEMIEIIKRLEEKGYTYRAGKYLVYDISKFPDYGKLSGKNLEELQSGARLEPVPGKRNPFDFALWIEDEKHLQKWESPWGVGYPGWHVECSAMSIAHLGEQLDVHTGGQDNIFPHHENEIAQSEAATGKQFVKYWIHAGYLQVEGGKMSKSKGNLYLIQDIIERGFDPLAFRYLCLTAKYRHPLNFTWEALEGAQSALKRLRRLFINYHLPSCISQGKRGRKEMINGKMEDEKLKILHEKFLSAVNNDLNTPQALSVVWDAVKEGEKNPDLRFKIYELLLDFDRVLGLQLADVESLEIPAEIQELIKKREEFRKEEQWEKADELRERIKDLGFEIEDTPQGTKVTPT